MNSTLYAILWLTCFVCVGGALAEAVRTAREIPTRRRLGAGIAVVVVLAASILAARVVSVRGAYDNNHDFQLIQADFFSPRQALSSLTINKELSPRFLMSLIDRPGGYSLRGLLRGQHLLWLASAFLIFAALRRGAGAGVPAAAFAALLLLFNYLSILNTRSFSTTNANIFFCLCAVCAAVSFSSEQDRRWSLVYAVWFLAALTATFAARYEFVPALAFLGVLVLAFNGRARINALWRQGAQWRGILCGAALVAAAGLILFGVMLPKMTNYNGPDAGFLLLKIFKNLHYQIGRQNFSAVFGIPSGLAAASAVGLLGALMAGAYRRRGRTEMMWSGFLAGWILSFSMVYMEIQNGTAPHYPLQFIRHHLYFFLPFVFLAGLWVQRLVKGRKAAATGFAAALVVVYAGFNIRHAAALETQWRTNDREWRFLLAAERAWPPGCGLVYADADNRDPRPRMLEKYFPPAKDSGCRMLFVSAHRQVFRVEARSGFSAVPAGAEVMQEESFLHRWYTNTEDAERREPIRVRIGLYRLP